MDPTWCAHGEARFRDSRVASPWLTPEWNGPWKDQSCALAGWREGLILAPMQTSSADMGHSNKASSVHDFVDEGIEIRGQYTRRRSVGIR
jgi:hypothetical protein